MPKWHTAALVFVILAVALTGLMLMPHAVTGAPSQAAGSRLVVYASVLAVQWGLLLYVCRIGRSRSAFAFLLGQGWSSGRRALGDLGLAALGWVVIEGSEALFGLPHAAGRNGAVVRILPSNDTERLLWVLVALSVGLCEEIVYRGYLRTQLTAFTRSVIAGVALQAILFGLAHAEQGPAAAVRLGVYGLALGALATWRGSLVPGIVCHIAIDLTSGLLAGR